MTAEPDLLPRPESTPSDESDPATDDTNVIVESSPMGPRATVTSVVVLAVGVAVALFGINTTELGAIDGLGLFSALSPWYYLGVAIVAVGFVVAAVMIRVTTAWAYIASLVVLLHGLPGILEPHPRFPVAWLHVGFTNQIAASGELLPFVDARFSWPGFFSAGAFLQRLSGTDSLLWVLRFAPIVINLVAAVLVWNLAMTLRSNQRQAAFAAGFFVLANWIGQDYFAPQAIGFIMSTFVLTVLLTWFPDRSPAAGWRRRLIGPPSGFVQPSSGRGSTVVYGGVVAVILALVASHQLSPVFLGSTLIALALVGRIRTRMLGVFVFVAMASWLSFGAEAYWLGHLDTLFGSAGQPSDVLNQNVSRRTTGGSGDRQIVLATRLAFSGALWGFTAIVLLVRRFRGRLDPALLALLFGPFVAVLAQPYGGELLLRVALFTLPVCSIVVAQVILPSSRRWAIAPISVAVVGLIPVFILARFGNEGFEMVTSGDLAIVEDLYDLAPDDSVVFVQNRQAIVSFERVGEVRFRSLAAGSTAEDAVDVMKDAAQGRDGGVYLLLTDSQAIFGTETNGFDDDWLLELGSDVLEDPAVTFESRRGRAILLSVGAGS